MSLDLNEVTTKIAELLWRDANPESPISQCDAWDYCRAQARDVMKVLAPFTTELEQAHSLIYDLRAALAAVEQERGRLRREVDRLDGELDKATGKLTVVRRERAWLLANIGYDQREEFRLLAQTAERAREDAKKTGRAHRFDALLADPNEQFDPRAELLASVAEYMNAPPAAASAQPKQPGGAYAVPLTDLIGIAPVEDGTEAGQ